VKKLITISLIALFAVCLALASVHLMNGDSASAKPFELVVVALTAVAFLAPAKNVLLGLERTSYFDKTSDPYTRAELELVKFLQKAKPSTMQDLAAGNLILDSYSSSIMARIPISTVGTIELLNAASVFAEGRIPEEFNQGILPQGFNISVSHVLVGYATDAAVVVAEGDVDYTNLSDSWPAALRNGSLRFFQSGALVKRFQGKLAGTKAAGVAGNGKLGLEFQCPFILEEIKQNRIDLITPAAVAFPATPAGLFIELILVGACTRQRS